MIIIRILLVAIASMALVACSASSPGGRLQMTAPTSVSAVYSEVNLQLFLITEANAGSPCVGGECEFNRTFDRMVLRLGTRLAESAFAAYPALSERFGKFEFVIAEKAGAGSISNAAGRVIIFRGVQKLHLGEEALAFLIAREMGHVIAQHHEENSATSILFSVLASAFVPVANLISGSAILAQTASASAMSTAATSAASFIGSKLTIASYKLDQSREADAIALSLLDRLGWNKNDIADALVSETRTMGDDNWDKEFRASVEDVARLAGAQNSITGLKVVKTENGKTVITVGLSQQLASLPVGFTTDDPPRIVLDFRNTTHNLKKSVQDFPEGDLHSTDIVQSAGRTRLVINLNRMLSYSARIEDKTVLITLQDKVAEMAAIDNTPNLAKADPRQPVPDADLSLSN